MNIRLVLKSIGILLSCEAVAIIPSLIVSLIYKESTALVFIDTILMIFCFSVPLCMIQARNKNMYARDGFAIVALGWLSMSLFGALPFYFSEAIPSFIDSFFETSSGFTTTGASILTNIEILPRGILFWRSFTHWIGGMGVIVLTLAILPSLGARGIQMMKAESPGPNPGKLVPKVGETAKILYGIYMVITIFEVSLLVLAGLPLYDAFIHTFGTVGTGGFSNMNLSIGGLNNIPAEIIITIFTFICGANFTLYYFMIKGDWKAPFKDEEFRFYSTVIVVAIALITLDINGHVFHNIWESLRHSSFQVVSIVTTTGFATTDTEQWSMLSKVILFILMFIGGCAGSTGGSLKNIRILLLLKIMKRELMQIVHPRAVYSVRLGKKAVDERTLTEVLGFFFMYMLVFIAGILIVSLDNLDWATTITSVAATLGNIGPGFGAVGAVGNYAGFSDLSKVALSIIMIVGRLEIYPILLVSMPSFWKRLSI